MKIIITEDQNEKLNKKIRLAVEKLGLVQARDMFILIIKEFGGFILK